MKDLPYFKFMVMDYLTGDIQMCSHETQGIFVNMLAKLWQKGGYLPADPERISRIIRADLQVVSKAVAELEQCQVLLRTNDDRCYVEFILEQIAELTNSHKAHVTAGRKGGHTKQLNRRSKARSELERGSTNQSQSQSQSQKKTPPAPHTDEDGMNIEEAERKHPLFARLRREPELHHLTLRQFLAACQKVPEFMDMEDATEYACGRAVAFGTMDHPGSYLEKQWSDYELAHKTETDRREGIHEQQQARENEQAQGVVEMVEVLRESGGPDSERWRAEVERFERVYGPALVDRALGEFNAG